MRTLNRLLLFIHPPAHSLLSLGSKPQPHRDAQWLRIVEEECASEDTAVLILPTHHGDEELIAAAQNGFGERCFVEPSDNGEETKLLLADDMLKMMSLRGRFNEWIPYELWSSNNARRWAEGMKREMVERGLQLDLEATETRAFGNWTGCNIKYSTFMPRYLDLARPALRDPVEENFPLPVREYVETVGLDAHVQLYLFIHEDGRPMAQFVEGIRAVWEPPHVCTVKIDPAKIELHFNTPNAFVGPPTAPLQATRMLDDGFVADASDGCRPAQATVVGQNLTYDEFRNALAAADVSDHKGSTGVQYFSLRSCG